MTLLCALPCSATCNWAALSRSADLLPGQCWVCAHYLNCTTHSPTPSLGRQPCTHSGDTSQMLPVIIFDEFESRCRTVGVMSSGRSRRPMRCDASASTNQSSPRLAACSFASFAVKVQPMERQFTRILAGCNSTAATRVCAFRAALCNPV